MRITKLIRHFRFEEINRKDITLEAGARLNPKTNRLQLDGPPFPATGIARTPVMNPTTVKQWLGFQAFIVQRFIGGAEIGGGVASVAVTSAGYRLTDGTDEFFHDGGSWVVNVVDFNTEEEVAANIATFPVTAQKLGVVVQLTTTDPEVTPELEEIRVLWASDVEHFEDVILRSLVRELRETVRPIGELIIGALNSGGDVTSVDLSGNTIETPYDLVDVDSVYDETADPDHLTDLFSSFDSGTKVVTLSAGVPETNDIRVRFVYTPPVAVTTSQDFNEISRVPILVLDEITWVDTRRMAIDDEVVDKGAETAVRVPAPFQGDIEIALLGITDKLVDHYRLTDQIRRFFLNRPSIRSRGLDERFGMLLVEEYDSRTPAGSADLHTGRALFRIRDVTFHGQDAVDVPIVTKLSTEDGFVIAEKA
ncbi:hypothetical protein LCGC14_0835770 [marine sediment metagenome]|uniref:Uncharacterized protein n=1 Tax=marine sediment metagenome TaxID=412755 RepID=A0A0F9PZZ0_9ZZZZ